MRKVKILAIFLGLIAYQEALAVRTIGTTQFLLELHKSHHIKLTKRQLSNDEALKRFNLLQEKQKEIKNPSFIQSKYTDLLQLKGNGYGTIPLKDYFSTIYTGPIAFSQQNNLFQVVYDTGSAPLFINSVHCQNEGCKNNKAYDSSKSNSYVESNPQVGVKVQFGSGAASGLLGQENVFLGGIEAKQTPFYQILDQQNILGGQNPFQGVVGLSLPMESMSSVFDTLVQQKAVNKPIFAFNLLRQESGSSLTIGGYNEQLFQNAKWHDVIDGGYWAIPLDKVSFGDNDTGACDNNCVAIIDSGTSVLSAPEESLSKISDAAKDFNCQNYNQMPNLVFEMSGTKYALSAQEYIVTVNGRGQAEFYQHSSNPQQCAGSFYPINIKLGDKNAFILGDTFMSKFNIAFDYSNKKIGIAHRN